MLNKSKDKAKIDLEITTDMMDKIAAMNSIDIQLYAYAIKKFFLKNPIDEQKIKSFRRKLRVFQFAHRQYIQLRKITK